MQNFLPCDPTYSMRRQNEFWNTIHDEREPNYMDDFCNQARHWIETGGYRTSISSELQVSSCCEMLQSLVEEYKDANDGEDEEVEINKKHLFQMERKPLFYI